MIDVPGDTVAMRNKRLHINGEAARHDVVRLVTERPDGNRALPAVRVDERLAGNHREVQWMPDMNEVSDFGPLTVPATNS